MEMKMVDGLPRILSGIGDHSEAFIQMLFFGDLCNRRKDMTYKCLIRLSKISRTGYMGLWYHQDVNGSLRVDIPECQTLIVLIHLG